jgi:addiction module RelE/StbE family toxin
VKVKWSPEAEVDRLEIFEFIAVENPVAAEKMNGLFNKAVERIARFPLSAREGDLPGTRELIPHPNYRIVYEIRGDVIWIAAIFHTARQWPPVLGEDD